MDQYNGEAPCAVGLRLPMTMAQPAAAIDRIDFDGFGDDWKKERRTGEIIADDRLHVAVGHAATRRKRNKIRGERGGANVKLCIFLRHLAHRELGK